MSVEMQTVNVNGTKKRESNPVRTGAQIGAAIGIGKLGIDTFKTSNRIYNATGNGIFKQIGQKMDEMSVAKTINDALNNMPNKDMSKNLTKHIELMHMLNDADDMLKNTNTDALIAKAKELGINAEAVSASKSTKFLFCTVLFGIFALINTGIGSLLGAGAGKIVEIFNNKKEAEKQDMIKQVKTELENK